MLRLAGAASNREGIGARVRLGAQCNQMPPPSATPLERLGVHFGLGSATRRTHRHPVAQRHPPSLENLPANQVLTVTETNR